MVAYLASIEKAILVREYLSSRRIAYEPVTPEAQHVRQLIAHFARCRMTAGDCAACFAACDEFDAHLGA
jgi:recombinational DNA repair protein RecR